MTVKTYTEILSGICDSFDALIAPRSITRSDDNLIYLMFKAIAKGYEVINNTVLSLQNKFNPLTCSDDDLESIGRLVGTSKLPGKQSAVRIPCLNGNTEYTVLPAGLYEYKLTEEIRFQTELLSDVIIQSGASHILSMYSTEVGEFRVTEQLTVDIVRVDGQEVPAGLEFSALDNINSLGRAEESNLAFRNRVLTTTDRQDVIVELENEIRALPYIFDVRVVFNNTNADAAVDGVTVHPFSILVALFGEPRAEIAEIVARHGFFPTTQVIPEQVLYYLSPCLAGGKYDVFYMLFGTYSYDIDIDYAYNSKLTIPDIVEKAITKQLTPFKYPTSRTEYITEDIFYNIVRALALQGMILRNISLKVGGVEVPFIQVPRTSIGTLVNITYTKVEI